MTHATRPAVLLVLLGVLPGCGFFRDIGFARNEPDPAAMRLEVPDEPRRVVVQHVLISFEGAGVACATRTREEAGRLAATVLEEARRGRNFAELVRDYSDDRAADGVHAIANWGVAPAGDEVERGRRVRGFATTAFSLAPGQVGLVEYDASASPYGWHVLKRLK